MSNQPQGVTDIPMNWKEEKDLLQIQDYLDGLKEFICTCQTPFSIAVQGDWGTGKTSVLNYIKTELESEESNALPVYFNTWQYSQFNMSQNLYLAFFASLLNAVSSEDNLAGLGVRVKKFMASALKNTISVGMKMSRDEVDALTDSLLETYNKDIAEISEFHDYFADFIEKELKKKGKARLVIFVDDLDRLEPNVAVGLLEVIKLFADVKQCVFVMAIDYDVVVQGVRQKYSNDIPLSKCRSFFDKIIQLSFRMPVEHYDLEKLVEKHLDGIVGKEFYTTLTEFIIHTIGRNPRAFKRMINSFLLIKSIYQKKNLEDVDFAALFCCLCIQNSSEETYTLLLSDGFWEDVGESLLSDSGITQEEVEQSMKGLYPQPGRIDADMVAKGKEILTVLPNVVNALYHNKEKGMQRMQELLRESSITALNATVGFTSKKKVNAISLDGELQDNIANATDALFKTYRHYLEEKSSGFTPEELVKRLSALCKENERDNGFFRSHKPLSVNGQTLWLGLSSSTEVKKSHADQLCQLLKLPKDAVQWFADGEQVYPASKQA